MAETLSFVCPIRWPGRHTQRSLWKSVTIATPVGRYNCHMKLLLNRYEAGACTPVFCLAPGDTMLTKEELPSVSRRGIASAATLVALVCALFCLGGCSTLSGTPANAVVGRAGVYDYSPSIIQVGHVQQFWWCGQGQNPADHSQNTDTIQYESINLDTGQQVGPEVVLAETPGAWDSAYTCNPQVVQGTFTNPLGDGASYKYALYYVGTAEVAGINNSIGAAFSNDGIHWKKYPSPVIPTTNQQVYGPAQPVPYNSDGKQAIWLFYEDDEPPLAPNSHVQTVSSDGVHFSSVGTLTTNGLNIPPTLASWGNIAYNPADSYWYASFNFPTRSLATTGNVQELGSYGFQVYRIPQNDLLAGKTGWLQLKTIDTNLTGYEMISGAGFARDPSGNLYQDDSGTLQIFPSFSNMWIPWNASPASAASQAAVNTWDIGKYTWSAKEPPLYDLKRYKNGISHDVTTGWIDPAGGFSIEETLGEVYKSPQQGATVALYSCKRGDVDFFLSLDGNCEGQHIIGINGYMYAQSVAGLVLSPLYRCSTGSGHFASGDPLCEGSKTEELLGYILPK